MQWGKKKYYEVRPYPDVAFRVGPTAKDAGISAEKNDAEKKDHKQDLQREQKKKIEENCLQDCK